ncbi:hypothetical protein YC2023_084360 [Brassica napus]
MKPNGKSPITSDYDAKVMFFRDVSPGPHETQLRFRLIHFWEAWNPLKKTLIGLEMLLIDEHVLDFTKHIYLDSLALLSKGFISPGRIERYLPKMKPGLVYRLNNFYGSSNKSVYRVFDHAVTVSLSWNSELSVLEDNPTPFDEDRFRFHSFEDFQANCDRKGDLYGNLCYPPHHLFVAVLDVPPQTQNKGFLCFTSQVRLLRSLCASPLRTDTEITIGSVYEALINAKLQPTA